MYSNSDFKTGLLFISMSTGSLVFADKDADNNKTDNETNSDFINLQKN
ncbi:hypothetical protein MASR2M117_18580 [Paludibacter sp.]